LTAFIKKAMGSLTPGNYAFAHGSMDFVDGGQRIYLSQREILLN
jgi:hypothetical protein